MTDDDYYAIICEPVIAGAGGTATTVVRLCGELDVGASDDLRVALLGVVTSGVSTHIVVDLIDLGFIDSETIRVLIEGYTAANLQGVGYRLANAHGLVHRVLTVMGLTEVLSVTEPGHVDPSP